MWARNGDAERDSQLHSFTGKSGGGVPLFGRGGRSEVGIQVVIAGIGEGGEEVADEGGDGGIALGRVDAGAAVEAEIDGDGDVFHGWGSGAGVRYDRRRFDWYCAPGVGNILQTGLSCRAVACWAAGRAWMMGELGGVL